eukprot:symbB.v1.2.016575.t1/scaffold1253.1/size128728/2
MPTLRWFEQIWASGGDTQNPGNPRLFALPEGFLASVMAANGNGAASKLGDMSDLLGLSKLQEVLQNLVEEQAKVDAVQKQQDEQVSTALRRLVVMEASCEVLPQLQRQLENVQEQTKALEEASRQLREQEAQLSSQAARLTLLEKQVPCGWNTRPIHQAIRLAATEVNDRLTSLESKVARLENTEEDHYTEVKAALVSIREGNERAAEVQAEEEARRKAREEELRRQEEEAEEQRRQEREALEEQLAMQVWAMLRCCGKGTNLFWGL